MRQITTQEIGNNELRDLNIIDALFDVNITSSYHLSIILQSDALSYAILDTVRGKFLVFKQIPFEEEQQGDHLYHSFEQLCNSEAYLSRNYKKLSFCYAHPKATLVPAPMYDFAEKEKYQLLFGHQNEEEALLDNYIQVIDTYLLFSIPERLINLAADKLDSPQFFHQANPLIENALINAKAKTGKNKVYANISNGFMDAVLIQEGQLKLYNSFPYKTTKDLVFYLLYLYDQFHLSNEHTSLELSGQTEEQGELHNYLQNYLKQIVFQSFNRSYSYSIGFNDLIQHHYSNLINLFRCE